MHTPDAVRVVPYLTLDRSRSGEPAEPEHTIGVGGLSDL